MDEQPQGKRGRTVAARRQRSALAASLAVHGLIVWALLASWLETPAPVEPQAMIVALLQLDAVAPKPAPAPKAKAATPAKRPRKPPANASPRKSLIRRTPSPRPTTVEPIPAAEPSPVLTAAQLAGAAVAGEDGGGSGSGGEGGGRRCDMAARVQNALRRDPLVRAAMTSAAGSATLVWDGDWVRSSAEDGKGLAAVREAILWEVGFAPPACRTQPVRGLILLTVTGARGPTRLALGSSAWRWTDLLTPAGVRPGR